jgi:hypothetical protein
MPFPQNRRRASAKASRLKSLPGNQQQRRCSMFQDREIGAITTGGPFGHPPTSKYDKLISLAKEVPPAKTVVVHPCDETSLRGPCEAAELGIITPTLVGPADKITAVARQHEIDISRYQLVDAPHSETAPAA